MHVLARLVLGIPDDLRWRTEHRTGIKKPMQVAVTLAAIGLLAAVLEFDFMGTPGMPDVPPVPLQRDASIVLHSLRLRLGLGNPTIHITGETREVEESSTTRRSQ